MIGESKQASSATMAIVYITVGALLDVWTVVYYIWSSSNRADGTSGGNSFLICAGFFTTGLVLIGIGLLVGKIGRSARQAETAATPMMPGVAAGVVGQPMVAGTVPGAVAAGGVPAQAVAGQPIVHG